MFIIRHWLVLFDCYVHFSMWQWLGGECPGYLGCYSSFGCLGYCSCHALWLCGEYPNNFDVSGAIAYAKCQILVCTCIHIPEFVCYVHLLTSSWGEITLGHHRLHLWCFNVLVYQQEQKSPFTIDINVMDLHWTVCIWTAGVAVTIWIECQVILIMYWCVSATSPRNSKLFILEQILDNLVKWIWA